MSILSRYYYKKYMIKTLSKRMSCFGCSTPDRKEEPMMGTSRSLLTAIDESYESAASGFFASSGQLVPKSD